MENIKRSMILLIVFSCALLSFNQTFAAAEEEVNKYCPVKYYVKAENIDSCLQCHMLGTFKLKTTNPLDKYRLPDIESANLYNENNKLILYFSLTLINSEETKTVFNWLKWNKEINQLQIEIHSPGGSLMDAWRIVGLIEEWKSHKKENVVETIVNGFAASAGFLIFMSGDIRAVSPTAELMWHELSVSSYGYRSTSPSTSKEQARVLAHLQKTTTEYISSKCTLSKEYVVDSVKDGRELWINGREALKMNIATKLLWDNKTK